MESKKIKAERSLTVGGVTLVPIVETASATWRAGGAVSFSGYRRPLAMVVITAGQKKVYRLTGEEISLDELFTEFPSIKDAIDNL